MSTPASTIKTVAPVILTPYSKASRGPWIPGKDGNRAGWELMVRPPNRSRKVCPSNFMNPAQTTKSGSKRATASVRRVSQAARIVVCASLRGSGSAKVGMPTAWARCRATASGWSEPTATMLTCSGRLSMRDCKRVPVPETRTTTRKATTPP